MSSTFVVDSVTNFLKTNAPTEKFFDLSAAYEILDDFLKDNGLANQGDPWIGLQFIGETEDPITIPATNTSGKYREFGAVYVHVVAEARLGIQNAIRTRGEALRNLLRGQRIANDIRVNNVTPLNFGDGATLQFEGGYTSASFLIDYQYDFDL